jgi:hypothetical protein
VNPNLNTIDCILRLSPGLNLVLKSNQIAIPNQVVLSIEFFNKSLEVFTQNKFPDKWQINQEDLNQYKEALVVEKQNLVKDIRHRLLGNR